MSDTGPKPMPSGPSRNRHAARSTSSPHNHAHPPSAIAVHPKVGTKLKLKIANQEKHQADGSEATSYLQDYGRELDSDPDEPVAFEEQFILKMPPGADCERLRELVEKRKEIDCASENVCMKFKDSRRGVFNIGKKMFGMKLVDLPCIVESQKTFDNKHVFKVADICQVSPFQRFK